MSELATVLVVEDDVDLAEITCEVIELAGLAAVFRVSVAEAIEYLARNAASTAALITDIHLASPMSGIELAVYSAAEWPHIAICVTSGVTDERPLRLPDGAAFMAKPWQAPELIRFAEAARQRHVRPV